MQAYTFKPTFSQNILLRLGVLALILIGAEYFVQEYIVDLYLRNQLTQAGLIVNGSIVALFLVGMIKIVVVLVGYRKQEIALHTFLGNLQTNEPDPAAGVLKDSYIHQRYDSIVSLSHQKTSINHAALAATLAATVSTRISLPKFINNILILTGVFGTIVSLSIALLGASNLLQSSQDLSGMNLVVHGMSTALSTTITAIVCYLVFGYFYLQLTDAQTNLLRGIEDVTTLFLLPRHSVEADTIIHRVADLIASLKEATASLVTAQREHASFETRLSEMAESMTQVERDRLALQQRLSEVVERQESHLIRLSRDLINVRKTLYEGFRLPTSGEG